MSTKKAPLVNSGQTLKQMPGHLCELWAHRELLYFVTWRDVKLCCKHALFGLARVISPFSYGLGDAFSDLC